MAVTLIVILNRLQTRRKLQLAAQQKAKEMTVLAEQAQAASKAKSTFLSNMTHDIRTPMNAIMGFSSLAEKYVNDPARVADCLQKINLSGQYLLRLINSVLDLAYIESGKMTLDIRAHDIPAMLKNVKYVFQADLQKKAADAGRRLRRTGPRGVL